MPLQKHYFFQYECTECGITQVFSGTSSREWYQTVNWWRLPEYAWKLEGQVPQIYVSKEIISFNKKI